MIYVNRSLESMFDRLPHGIERFDVCESFQQKDLSNDVVVFNGPIAPRCGSAKKKLTFHRGFFANSCYLDTYGFMEHSSLSIPDGISTILKYKAPYPASDLLKRTGFAEKITHPFIIPPYPKKKVILAAQKINDRAIQNRYTVDIYLEFIEKACKAYSSDLFVKLHPAYNNDEVNIIRELCHRNNAECGYADIDILNDCEHVITFNSTFIVIAILKRKPVISYAWGSLSMAPGVQHERNFPVKKIKDLSEEGQKLLDFLAWRYCWLEKSPYKEKILSMYESSDELFPLEERYSLGNSMLEERFSLGNVCWKVLKDGNK